MAVVRLLNGKDDTVSAEVGAELWLVLNGYKDGTPEQQEYCSKVKTIYLNWRKAPDEWIKDNWDLFRSKARDEWYIDNNCRPTRPQYDADKDLALKWKLFNEYSPYSQNNLSELI